MDNQKPPPGPPGPGASPGPSPPTATPEAVAYLTADEVVTTFFGGKVSRNLVYKLFHAGALRGIRAGARLLIDPESVREYIVRQAGPPVAVGGPAQAEAGDRPAEGQKARAAKDGPAFCRFFKCPEPS